MRIGIYQSYWGSIGGGQAYLGVGAEVLARTNEVEIVHHCEDFNRAKIEDALELDLSRVRFRLVPRHPRPNAGGWNPLGRFRAERDWCADYSAPYDVFINCSSSPPFFCHARQGVALVYFPETRREEFQSRHSQDWESMFSVKKAAYRVYQDIEWKRRCGSYQTYISISEYSRHWLEARWGVRSTIVYPPLRQGLEAGAKENLVLSIGRFHPCQHKKPEATIDAFKALCEEGLRGWHYTLVGPVSPDPEHLAYLEKLKASAVGYPISFATDVPAQELRRLLGSAALLWHSMGYGVDEQQTPDRLEHFGMVATEAMAAGCVPILFKGGGLAEIVQDGQNGYLWRTIEELKAATRRVAGEPSLRPTLARAAEVRAQAFSRSAFEKQWLEAMAPALN